MAFQERKFKKTVLFYLFLSVSILCAGINAQSTDSTTTTTDSTSTMSTTITTTIATTDSTSTMSTTIGTTTAETTTKPSTTTTTTTTATASTATTTIPLNATSNSTANGTSSDNGNSAGGDYSVTPYPITINPSTLAEWDRQDKQEMIVGIGMGVGCIAGIIVVGIIVICLFCRVKIDRHQKYLQKVAEAKRKIELQQMQDRMRQRAPGISNELVTGYAGGMRNTWDPFNF